MKWLLKCCSLQGNVTTSQLIDCCVRFGAKIKFDELLIYYLSLFNVYCCLADGYVRRLKSLSVISWLHAVSCWGCFCSVSHASRVPSDTFLADCSQENRYFYIFTCIFLHIFFKYTFLKVENKTQWCKQQYTVTLSNLIYSHRRKSVFFLSPNNTLGLKSYIFKCPKK